MKPIILHADHMILMDQNNSVIPNGAVLVGSDPHPVLPPFEEHE